MFLAAAAVGSREYVNTYRKQQAFLIQYHLLCYYSCVYCLRYQSQYTLVIVLCSFVGWFGRYSHSETQKFIFLMELCTSGVSFVLQHLRQRLSTDYACSALAGFLYPSCFWATISFTSTVYCQAVLEMLSSGCLCKLSYHLVRYSIIFSFIENLLSSCLISPFLSSCLNVYPETERKGFIFAACIHLKLIFR